MKDYITDAIEFLEKRGYKIPIEILFLKSNKSNSDKEAIVNSIKNAEYKQGEYSSIRNTMWAAVYDQVYGYLSSNRHITVFRQTMSTAVSAAYVYASERAWLDGGGTLPLDEDTKAWAKAELNAQLLYIDSLFETLKKLRKEGDFDTIHEAFSRADGYASALDGFYNYIKASAYGGKMLTFTGSDGRESCYDCKRLKGQRKRASWWASHELVPPSRHFECRGYHCDHFLVDDKGNRFTV